MSGLTLLSDRTADSPGSRTGSDRLELLTALIAAPTFDPLFRTDVISFPRRHPHYGWICGVPDCTRGRGPARDFCHEHESVWARVRADGGNIADFLKDAEPLVPAAWHDPPLCRICPGIPASGMNGLCFLHKDRWWAHRAYQRDVKGRTADLDEWIAGQTAFSSFGACQAVVCPELADNPLGLCGRHRYRYRKDGEPGGAELPRNWGRWQIDRGKPVPVSYRDEARFRQWCVEIGPITRMNGKLSLLGLQPLVKTEIKWLLFHHAQSASEGSRWSVTWLQYVAEDCRRQEVSSLADLDLDRCRLHARKIVKRMLHHLRLVYFTRQDTRAAGFIETDHFGVRFTGRGSHIDLSGISQRWLRELLWDWMAARLSDSSPPRAGGGFDSSRRGCVELSAFLEAQAPGGGHDPTLLTSEHMTDFVADQRHRARHGLESLAIHSADGKPTKTTPGTVRTVFNGTRRFLRAVMETGETERVGLARAFIVALPSGGESRGRRSPFPDEVARALAAEGNLAALAEADSDDRGARDIWEALVLTGRRCGEVREVRLECVARLGGLPMFWHDQTKIGNLEAAIRIPEYLFQRIEVRQAKSVARFVQKQGRPPTPQERREIALFPRRTANRSGRKGVSGTWFNRMFRRWIGTLDIGHCVPHQARHTLATRLLKAGANLTHIKRYLGHVSDRMAEHYVHLANTDPRLEQALAAVWVAGPGSGDPGLVLSTGQDMTREQAEALAVDLTRRSTPAEGGFCTFQPVVNGDACPWNMNCHNCDKFVLSGADLVYWHRKREQWRMLAERAPDPATADFLHAVFEPTARAIDGLEKALAAVDLLDEALALDLRRPQDYFGRVWATAFRANELAQHEDHGDTDFDNEYDADDSEDLA
ncbi:tyrosine-type recombinase/integrase [Streptomyces xanthochromogenes]|uniref:tyrosine-type recombinase/integrase n=1 Tax=Streptomyces xanthochromogenes TaxID=67384 RepID=UPI00380CABE0